MKRGFALPAVTLGFALWLTACNLPAQPPGTSEPAPQTAAARTVEAVLTVSGPGIQQTGQALQTAGPVSTTISPSPTSPATPTSGTPEAACENKASFIDDVTIRDNAEIDPETDFVKIWRLRNDGSCTWTPAYLLTFFGGQRLEAPSTVTLSGPVAPGETVDLAVDMQAPEDAGTYQGFWKLRSPDGRFFGIGPQGDQSFWVKIVVPAPPTEETAASATPSVTPTPSPTTPAVTATSTATVSPTPTPTASATEGETSTLTPTAAETPGG